MTGGPDIPAVRMAGVHKAFGSRRVLRGIDLSVGRGESLVIIGGSGSGKSVTLKCLLGLMTPDRGAVEIAGENAVGLSDRARARVNDRIGMLFQAAALFDSLSVIDNVAFGLIHGRRRTSRAQARAIALDKLAAVGMDETIARASPADLSAGMRKRVGLARAIATDPDIILFDEPTTGLDPIMGDMINDLIVDITRRLGATGITITHDMDSARKIGDRVAMLHRGRIVWDGPVADIERCGNPDVERFVTGAIDGPLETAVSRV